MVTQILVDHRGRGSPLTIDERDPDVVVLLFLQHAWGIDRRSLPLLDPVPLPGSSKMPSDESTGEWEERWWRSWQHLQHNFVARDRFGSAWQDRFGSDGIDLVALHAWRDALIVWPPPPRRKNPEWRARRALQAAQSRGLSRLLVLPSSELWFERRDSGTLLVSHGLRADTGAFIDALEEYFEG